jgi:hypothetical protein
MILVTHQESDYDGDTVTQREIKELYCPVSSDESQIKEVSIDLFEHFDFSPENF